MSDMIACSFCAHTFSNNHSLIKIHCLPSPQKFLLYSIVYFPVERRVACGPANPLACSIRMRLTSWIVSGFP
jgi:hypothetical protein